MNDSLDNHPLSEISSDYLAGYPSSATTSILKKPLEYYLPKGNINVTGKILAIRFTNDHKKLRDAKTSFESEGKRYPKPEWITGAVNFPITISRNQRIRINVAVIVDPIGTTFKIIGDGGKDYLYFEKDGEFSVGAKQYIFGLRAKKRLSGNITRVNRKINWYIIGQFGRVDLGSSGPHEIFVLWDRPKTIDSYGVANYLTYKRIKFLTSSEIAGGKQERDVIAKSTQTFINNPKRKIEGKRIHIAFGTPPTSMTKSSDYWALLDGGGYGQCFEASILMELMLRLLGIKATQKHIRGATDWKLIKENMYCGKYKNDAKRRLPQERDCIKHGREQLWLRTGSLWNPGQGCCEVNDKLYVTFFSNIIGIRLGKRSPAHHVLLQLEKKYKTKSSPFQTWTYFPLTGGGPRQCKVKKIEGGQGVPNPDVPPVPK